MHPRTNEQEIEELRVRVRDLELAVQALDGQAKLIRFIGGAMIVALVGLIANALSGLIF